MRHSPVGVGGRAASGCKTKRFPSCFRLTGGHLIRPAATTITNAAATVRSNVEVPVPMPAVSASTRGLGGSLPDVIWGVGRSAEQISSSLYGMTQHQRVALAARIDPDMAQAVHQLLPDAEYNACARILTLRADASLTTGRLPPKQPRLPGSVALVLGAMADASVSEECRAVADHLGCYVFRVKDATAAGLLGGVGGAGGAAASIRAADVVVVVSGQDAALPSIVASLVDAPVIAVPSSQSHSLVLFDESPAPAGVTVVAANDGLGAAVMAARMLRMASRLHSARVAAIAAAEAAAKTAVAA